MPYNKKMQMIPLWAAIKLEILGTMYDCNEILADCREGTGDWLAFFSKVIKLYILLKPKLRYIDPKKYEKLKLLDKHTHQIQNGLSYEEWVNQFLLLQEAIEDLGITQIEVPVEEELQDEHALIKGHTTFNEILKNMEEEENE